MTTQLVGKNCDEGHYTCSPPKDCCKQGCCFLLTTSLQRPQPIPAGTLFSPHFLGLWYFWVAIMATLAGILCACSLWRRHSYSNLCCKGSNRDDRASEPDSNGSCYAPPQYSRCNSFYQAPPPYSEVTSKPDLYPLVISYNGDPVVKNNSGSTGYLMVQYFKNFIVRPVGTLSATSTVDSLSSSFICSAANEANTVIPPPYSCMGSLEEVTTEDQMQMSHSTSLHSNTDFYQPVHTTPSVQSPIATQSSLSTPSHNRQISIRDNPCFATNNEAASMDVAAGKTEVKCKTFKLSLHTPKGRSQDSASQEDFSDLLNLSLCAPNLNTSVQSHYSVTNSMTGSDISSLANGSPHSPPRATSPTLEMRELLDKIQQLPQQKSPVSQEKPKGCFHSRAKAKTLYMPLYEGPKAKGAKVLPSWLSRSAPNTPCGNFVPSFPVHKKGTSQGLGDGRPLLKEYEESEEESERRCS